jgi:hypothetical protein
VVRPTKQQAIKAGHIPMFSNNFGGFAEIVMEFAKITAWTAGRAADNCATRSFGLSGQRPAGRWILLKSVVTGR